jgi:hypothetical protein
VTDIVICHCTPSHCETKVLPLQGAWAHLDEHDDDYVGMCDE